MLTQEMVDAALQEPDHAIPSPCVNVCQIDSDSGYCLGCWRTLDEIGHWGDASGAERKAVWQQLLSRCPV